MKPIFGLMVRYRKYKCLVCDHEQSIQTNHTDNCFSHCGGCSWRSDYNPETKYRYDAGTHRPFTYIGGEPANDEYNPIHYPEKFN